MYHSAHLVLAYLGPHGGFHIFDELPSISPVDTVGNTGKYSLGCAGAAGGVGRGQGSPGLGLDSCPVYQSECLDADFLGEDQYTSKVIHKNPPHLQGGVTAESLRVRDSQDL